MPDKKPTEKKESTKKVDKKLNKGKESKSEAFLRIAESRIKSALNRLRLIGNCSNKANYQYTQEQVENMSNSLYEALATTMAKFTPSKAEQEQFSF